VTDAERNSTRARSLALLLVVCLFSACSMMFPHTELAIAPKGATLNELGIAIIADIERWFTSLLFILGILGL